MEGQIPAAPSAAVTPQAAPCASLSLSFLLCKLRVAFHKMRIK